MRISGTDIYIAQGDSATLTLSFEEEQEGLKMWIGSIKDSVDGDFQSHDGNLYHYKFEIENTHTNIVGSFNYDISKTDNAGKKTTVIRNSLFVVEPTAEGQSASQSSSQQSGSNPEE